ncbi:hypothetical protein FEM48_Zijuj06G0188200 [Ziziphus jujuba var. spinosa]|uniref:Pectinesterase inhibitor domain-containing protein n=1 Tax=Ziziphus jujuba var. spinosa TaxID=714518 RepID=A0A978VB06_ZIZJJ|nr:hypothetical protein FEM48_Zijuj06G0188200 [Ziziphus jujuba var. spinosa]
MEFPTQFITFFTISLLIFLSTSPSPTNATSKLVDSVCRKTDYSSKCQQLIGSDPRTKDLVDPKKLAKVVLEMGISDAERSYKFINRMLKNNPTEPIKKCLSSYQDVAATFKSALAEIDEDPETANYDVKIAVDYADDCENELAKGPPNPEISARNVQVRLYSSIGFVVTAMLPLPPPNN